MCVSHITTAIMMLNILRVRVTLGSSQSANNEFTKKGKRVIDIITTDKHALLVLTISDHLEWDNENEHLLLLQDKIHSYLDFIENGQLVENYPDKADKEIMIQIIFKYYPNKTADKFLAIVERFLNEKGHPLISINLKINDIRFGLFSIKEH